MVCGGNTGWRLGWLTAVVAAAFPLAVRAAGIERITPDSRSAIVWRSASQARSPADRLQYEHRYAEAAAALDRTLAASPDDAQALLQRAQINIALARPRAALADCTRAAPRLDALTASACQAQALGALGSRTAARTLIESALSRTSSSPEVLSWAQGIAAELAFATGDASTAERRHRAALANAGSAHFPRVAYAEFLLARGRAGDVLALLRQAPDDSTVIRLRRRALEKLP